MTAEMGAPTPMSQQEAMELTATIRTRTEEVWDLVVLAFTRRADLALGYDSWDDYCAGEFASTQIRIPAEDRPGVVLSLTAQGMSTRAIAAAMGTSAGTVRRDRDAGTPFGRERRLRPVPSDPLDSPGGSSDPPEGGTPSGIVTGLDGKRYPVRRPRAERSDGTPEGTSAPVRRATETWEGLSRVLEAFARHPEDGRPNAIQQERIRLGIAAITRRLDPEAYRHVR